MLEKDIIEEVTEASLWVLNLVFVHKKLGDPRVCCNIREVSKVIIREGYVLPEIEDTFNAMINTKSGIYLWQDHGQTAQWVCKVFNLCCRRNLELNCSKCEFGVKQISILYHVGNLWSFLGTCGYVSKFIPNYANIVEPLQKLTQ